MINSTIELEAVTVQDDTNGHGPPDHAGEQGSPDHAGEQGPPDHAGPPDGDGDVEHAWVGVSPAEIEGETNPNLSVTAGEEYTVEWTNTDGVYHNFAIADDGGDEVLASEGTETEGETETVEFTATEEMAEYLCDPHPDDMQGEVDVDAPEEAVFEVSDLDPAEATVERGDSLDISATIMNVDDREDAQEIDLLLDDEVVDSRELSLEACADETVTFEDFDTSDLEEGEYTYAVASDDDSQEGTLTVETEETEVLWHRDHEWETDPSEATDWDNYHARQVGSNIDSLMAIDVDPDSRIWYVTRGANFSTDGDGVAEVGWIDPATDEQQIALELDVIVGGTDDTPADHGDGTAPRELGAQSVAIDPDFEDNGYVYVYYHPSSEDMEIVDSPYHEDITRMLQYVSRFEMDGDVLDPDSEEVILEIPLQIDGCCHIGGYLEFGPDGDLYVTTGDDTNQDGVPSEDTPQIHHFTGDEREGYVNDRPAAISDAQRTSQNTADLRGKVLRIAPREDSGYEIPSGNLKEWYEGETDEEYGEDEILPEIYAMGFRNPYVVHVDDHTGFLFVADYGNDAPSWDPNLGTIGQATYHLLDEPANAGFPYFKGFYPNRYYDFDTRTSGPPFWPGNLRNRSPNNTGIENVPNATPALVWVPQDYETYEDVPEWAEMPRRGETTWPEIPALGSANAGPSYRYSDSFDEGALDPYFEGKQFVLAPYNDSWMGYFTYNEDGTLDIEEFLPDHDFGTPTDMEVLPDGRLVLMDYDSTPGSFTGDDGGIHLIEYMTDGEPEPEPEDPLSAPYGMNAGGDPSNPGSETPVVIDDLEFEGVADVDDVPQLSASYDEDGQFADESWFDPPASAEDNSDSYGSIENTDYDALYQTELWAEDLSFEFDLENGTYDVTLHWAEIGDQDGAGERVFDVLVQDETVLEEFDIYAEAGDTGIAVSHTVESVQVDDETLSVESISHEDATMFCGIEIRDSDDEPEDDGDRIELEGSTDGWEGVSPEEIDGEENPALSLIADEEYTVEWTNVDGVFHNFAIEDDSGGEILSSEGTPYEGESETIEFTATEEMASYVCQPHPQSMQGDIEVD